MVHRWFTTMPLFCPSFLQQGLWEWLPHQWQASWQWILFSPMMLGASVGITLQKNCISLWEAFVAWLAAFSSHWLVQTSCTSFISVFRKFVSQASPENRGEIVGPFLHKHASVGWLVGLSGHLYDLRILGEGLPNGSPWGVSLGDLSLSISLGMFLLGGCLDWPLPLLLLLKLLCPGWMKGAAIWFWDGGVSILGTVGGEAVNGSSPSIWQLWGDFWGSWYAFHSL